MTRSLKLLTTVGLAAALLLEAGAERAVAVAYKASIINLTGYDSGGTSGISGTSVVGIGYPSATGGYYDALLWNSTTNSLVSLNPGPDWSSTAIGASADTQVGAGVTSVILNEHALLWHGTAGSFVDLNPVGFYTTTAYAVSGNNQVGIGGPSTNPGGGDGRACSGTARPPAQLISIRLGLQVRMPTMSLETTS